MTSELISELHDSVGYLWLNRPDVHNAISRSMWDAIPSELESLKARGAKVIIIGGKGNSFASGVDFREFAAITDYSQARENWHAISNCLNSVSKFPLPTIAMISGNCIGGGLLLSLSCDLRYADNNSTFSLPIARLGIVLDDRNIQRLVSLIGVAKVKEMIYRANKIGAYDALQIGLINAVVEFEGLGELVRVVANEILGNTDHSMEQAKLSVGRVTGNRDDNDSEEIVIRSYLSANFDL